MRFANTTEYDSTFLPLLLQCSHSQPHVIVYTFSKTAIQIMRRPLESSPSEKKPHLFSFVMISDPSAGADEEAQRQIRSHAANSWRGVARQRYPRRGGLRLLKPVEQNSTPSEHILESEQVNSRTSDDPVHQPRLNGTQPFASSAATFSHRSPTPGPSPVTYLGGGRMDPFESCAVQCNTMESFLLDHCKALSNSCWEVRPCWRIADVLYALVTAF